MYAVIVCRYVNLYCYLTVGAQMKGLLKKNLQACLGSARDGQGNRLTIDHGSGSRYYEPNLCVVATGTLKAAKICCYVYHVKQVDSNAVSCKSPPTYIVANTNLIQLYFCEGYAYARDILISWRIGHENYDGTAPRL